LAPPRLALLTTGLAIVATWAATRSGTTLVSHAIVYLLAAGVASGMVTASVSALAAPVSGSWVQFRPVDVIVVAGCAICWAIAPSAGLGELGAAASRVVLALLLILGAAGSLIALLGSFLPAVDGGPVDAGALATLRTAVLAVVAVALAWAGTGERFRESRWLFYPLLAAAGVKLVVEDLPRSRPQTLFIALAVYGLALIAAPRLSRRRSA
jgi:hypothetical protein